MGVGFREEDRRGTGESQTDRFAGTSTAKETGKEECSWQRKWSHKEV